MKVARWVREGTVGKGPQGTSLAVYFMSWESRPTGEDEKVVYRAKPGRCLEQTEREVSEMENTTTRKLLTG